MNKKNQIQKIFLSSSLKLRWAGLLIFLLISGKGSFAQTHSISGSVKDSLGNYLEGVNVSVLNTDFGAATNQLGLYRIDGLKPAAYSIKFSAIGYRSVTKSNIIIKNKNIVLNVILKSQVLESGQVVVTASKYEQKVSDLPVSADIIPSSEFSKKNFSNLQNALKYAPGINMTDDQISIRGSSGYSRGAGSRVVLAIDGIPLYTGDTGETIWETIPVAAISRVEIIKGAASSLYGSTAIGGVVNIITKNIPDKSSTFFSSYAGFYDKPSYSEWNWSAKTRLFNGLTLGHSDNFGDFKYEASFSRLEDNGYKQNAFFHKYIGFFKGEYKLNQQNDLTFLATTFNKRSGNFLYWKDSRQALIPPAENLGQITSTNRYLFGIIYNDVISDNFLLKVKSSYYLNKWNDGSVPLNESTSNLYRTEIQTNASLSQNFVLTSGIEGVAANVSSTLFGNPNLKQAGIYTQGDLSFSFPLILTAGVRFDISKLDTLNSTDAVSPKLGLNYKLSNQITLRSSLGTGFRAPSLAEAFTSTTANGITVEPNPNLKSEKNFTTELGVNYEPANYFSFDAAAFWNEYYNFIEPGIDPANGMVLFSNLTRAKIQGVELNSNVKIFSNSLQFSLHYTYLWARNLDSHTPLKYRPRNTFYGSVDYYFKELNVGADFRYWSRVEAIDEELINLGLIPDGNLRTAVYVLDFRAAFKLNMFAIPVNLFFNVNNIFNYNYVELIANLEPLRNYSLRIQLNF